VFALLDKPGALLDALSEFKERKINLVKLESRPRRLEGAEGFNYTFYLDFAGHY
jgi:chorismate mutase/prephenate dehydratase